MATIRFLLLLGSVRKPSQCGQYALYKLAYLVLIELTQMRVGDVWVYRVDDKMKADHDIVVFRRIQFFVVVVTRPGIASLYKRETVYAYRLCFGGSCGSTYCCFARRIISWIVNGHFQSKLNKICFG